MKTVTKFAALRKTKLRPLQRAVQIMRSAPSKRAGFKEIIHKIGNRLPATTSAMREAKTQLWQSSDKFESFVRDTDASRVPSAAYMDSVINDFFLSRCPAGARVLDVGCGHGIVAIFLAKHGLSVTACDVSERMVEELKRTSDDLNISVHRADAYNMPFRDNEFDVVVARMFLYQFPDWPKILKEMARCCRRGGQLLIHFTSKENIDVAQASCAEECDLGDFGAPRSAAVKRKRPEMFHGAFDRREIDRACKRAGLRVVERAPCMFFHHNHLIARSLATEGFQNYRKELAERVTEPKVREFIVWFERTVVQAMPAWISHFNILVLEKL